MDKNWKLFKNSKLHDYELLNVDVNYVDCEINIKLKSPADVICYINIKGFISCEVSHKELWGSGKYIVFSDITYNNETNLNIMELELNSGDMVKIIQ